MCRVYLRYFLLLFLTSNINFNNFCNSINFTIFASNTNTVKKKSYLKYSQKLLSLIENDTTSSLLCLLVSCLLELSYYNLNLFDKRPIFIHFLIESRQITYVSYFMNKERAAFNEWTTNILHAIIMQISQERTY